MRDGEIYAAVSYKLQLKELAGKDAEIERLREALKPFAEISLGVDEPGADADEWFRHDGDVLTVGDFRAARRALDKY